MEAQPSTSDKREMTGLVSQVTGEQSGWGVVAMHPSALVIGGHGQATTKAPHQWNGDSSMGDNVTREVRDSEILYITYGGNSGEHAMALALPGVKRLTSTWPKA